MKPRSKLEASFCLLEKCTSVEKDLIWVQSNCDPFAAILSFLEKKEVDLPSCPPTCCCMQKKDIHEVASTSKSSSNNVIAQFFDVRVRYGHLLMLILRQIADELKFAKRGLTDDSFLLSINHSAQISSAFQFFILTCISPYLDEGVGIPLQLRSHVIRSWEKCKSDKEFQEFQLTLASNCIATLLECNDALCSNLIRRYCPDIVCVFEQLMMLKNGTSSIYEGILNKAPPQILVCAFLSLLKPRCGAKPPQNYVMSIGSHLSKILMAEGGLRITLASYEEINGELFWQNAPFLSSLAKQFVLPPRNTKRMAYYRNITSQFIEVIKADRLLRTKVGVLFSMFSEELREKNELAACVFIDDVLFKPWEALSSSAHHCWTDEHSSSLCLLRLWSDAKSSARCLKANPRFFPCVATLLSFLSITDSDKGTSFMSVSDDIFAVLKCAIEYVENLPDFFLTFISDPSPCFDLVQRQALIQAVDGHPSLYGRISLRRLVLNGDQLLTRRIDSTIAFLKSLDKPLQSQLLIAIICKSVTNWSCDGDRDALRFINHEENRILPRSSWHFVAGVFFEQMNDADIDCQDKGTVLSLLNLTQEVLQSTMQHLKRRKKMLSCLDVVAPNEEANHLHATILQNAKMAVGLAGAIIMTAFADEQISLALSKTCAVLISFSNFLSSSKCGDDEITVLATDSLRLATLFEKNLILPDEHPLQEEREAQINPIDSIRERLAQNSPVDRGGALLDAGRLIRHRSTTILLQLEEWLFRSMEDALYDHDSYVYLAAINALAEASCYNSKYLREMISLFRDFNVSKLLREVKVKDDEAMGENEVAKGDLVRVDVIIRSRLCEVIGKVFRELGDMGPVWMDECAGVFLTCLSENDEILRASALQSLAELIQACQGRNLEKYLSEIFLAVERLLSSETSTLVRRSTVNLLRQTIKSCDKKIFEIVGSLLRDLHRRLLHLWRFDSDHVVRLHAELALEELKMAVKNTVLEETSNSHNVKL